MDEPTVRSGAKKCDESSSRRTERGFPGEGGSSASSPTTYRLEREMEKRKRKIERKKEKVTHSLVYGLACQLSPIILTVSSANTLFAVSVSPDILASFRTFESCFSCAKYTSAVLDMANASGLNPAGRGRTSAPLVLGGRGVASRNSRDGAYPPPGGRRGMGCCCCCCCCCCWTPGKGL